MRPFLLALLAGALLLFACSQPIVEVPEGTVEAVPVTPWEELCAVAECAGVQEPQVIQSVLLDGHYLAIMQQGSTLRGIYIPDEQIIFLSSKLTDDEVRLVTIHEMAHHLFAARGVFDRCISEALARNLTAYITGYDMPGWREKYGCE